MPLMMPYLWILLEPNFSYSTVKTPLQLSWINKKTAVHLQGVPEKTYKVLHVINFEPFAVDY